PDAMTMPRSRTTARSARPIAASIRCSMRTTVSPSPRSVAISSVIARVSVSESPPKGSSSRMSRGRPASARAISRRFCTPTGSSPAGPWGAPGRAAPREAGRGEQGGRLRAPGRAPPRAQDPRQTREAVTAEAYRDIVGGGEAREDAGDLEGAREAGAGEVMPVTAGELAAIEDDAPGVGRYDAGET